MIDKDLILQVQQEQLREQIQKNAGQKTIIDNQNSIIDRQQTSSKLLEARVEALDNNQKKDSTNSSKPPSSDIGKPQRTQSLRAKSGKKPGGQHGHSGQTLCFSSTPDEVVIDNVDWCRCCGKSLPNVAITLHTSKVAHKLWKPSTYYQPTKVYWYMISGNHTMNLNAAMLYGSVHHLRDSTFCHEVEKSSHRRPCQTNGACYCCKSDDG